MKIYIDRKMHRVRVEGLTVNEACWLGYTFVKDYPALAEKWGVTAYSDSFPLKSRHKQVECHEIASFWGSNAYKIADLIKAGPPPPPPPKHHCPNGECKTACCH